MLNKVQLIGRLGKDPEVRHLESGSVVANFSLATSEKYKDKSSGETKENTEWHHIVTWNNTAKVAEKYLHKGDLVYVEGKIATRSWEKEGVTKYITEIIVFNLTMLSTKRTDNSSGESREESRARVDQQYNEREKEPEYKASSDSSATDDLPF